MGKKDKTISFRVSQEAFESLQEIADERDLSLSALFRDYVDALVAHDGQVEVVPDHAVDESAAEDDEPTFPPRVTVPKGFVREHERLELEADHLREQLEEYRQYVTHLHDRLDDEDDEDVVFLEELDGDGGDEESLDDGFEIETDERYRVGRE
ncbi:ribbon-helix-helix protein, CopG family [Halobaculum sp. MBLA0147]|uniref:ribbon-helix-helix protein, CopG family n=1 Tax=Halobaculum sp. MBLA0147 TaxID=3079934 RepID=UPI0035261D11